MADKENNMDMTQKAEETLARAFHDLWAPENTARHWTLEIQILAVRGQVEIWWQAEMTSQLGRRRYVRAMDAACCVFREEPVKEAGVSKKVDLLLAHINNQTTPKMAGPIVIPIELKTMNDSWSKTNINTWFDGGRTNTLVEDAHTMMNFHKFGVARPFAAIALLVTCLDDVNKYKYTLERAQEFGPGNHLKMLLDEEIEIVKDPVDSPQEIHCRAHQFVWRTEG